MGEPCHNWFTDMEIQDDVLFNQRHKIESLVDGDQMFREMMHHQPAFCSDSESHSPTTNQNINNNIGGSSSSNNNVNLFNNNIMNNSSNFIFSSQHALEKPVAVTSPTSFILSFGDSTVVAATRQTYGEKQPFHPPPPSPPPPPPPPPSKGVANQTATKKTRSSTETLDHIMAERKRRRELTERFIALSATIPGLKKIDKSTILGEAITHVKRLQERVRELEEQSKKTCVESVSFIRKTTEKGTTSSAILDTDDCYKTNEALPTVEARVFKKDVLLRIHSKIESGILLKILDHLKNLDLSTISTSVTPFGNSTLDISIIAQMGDKLNITINDLVKNLRLVLLESEEVKVQ